MKKHHVLTALGAALTASNLVKSVSSLELDDVLGGVGLSRRRSHFFEKLGLVAAGAAVGAGAAVLLAPMSGRETRQRLSEGAKRFGDAARDAVREHKDEARQVLSDIANGTSHSEMRS